MKLLGLVGPGNLGRTLALSIPPEICTLGPVLSHSKISSRRAVREMRRGYAVTSWAAVAEAQTILVAAPQAALADVLREAAEHAHGFDRKRILVTSFADGGCRAVIQRLTRAGADIGGLLPIALYRRPSLVTPGTTFAVWGNAAARRTSVELVKAVRGQYAAIDDGSDAETLRAAALFCGALTTSIELAVRLLVTAGFKRQRAIAALAPLAEGCLQEHRRSRQGPPRLPRGCAEILRAADAAGIREAALCRDALRLAFEDLQ